MYRERRQYARRPGPYPGAWHDASGTHECRITFLSPGGCFIDSPAAPEAGAAITVTVAFGETRFTVPAEVTYRDLVQGFGVRFVASDQTRAFAYVMGPTEPLGR